MPPWRSLASRFRSVTNWLAFDGEPAICERRLLVIPLVDKRLILPLDRLHSIRGFIGVRGKNFSSFETMVREFCATALPY